MTTAELHAQHLHLIVRALMGAHGFAMLLAVRRARDFCRDHGHDLPAADIAEEIARNERRLQR